MDPVNPDAIPGTETLASMAGNRTHARVITDIQAALRAINSNAAADISAALLQIAARLLASNNLDDLDDVPTARTNLGLGSAALASSADFDAAGAAATALASAHTYTDSAVTALALGTASTHAAGDFDASGAAAAALSTAETYADGKVDNTAYNATTWDDVNTIAPSKNAVRDYLVTLGSAAFVATSAFDAAGAAAIALSTAEAYTDTAVAGVTLSGLGGVPTTRTVNGHALSANVTVTAGDLSLGNVENTALSTWAGTANVTTLGTVTTGVWHGTAIAATYIGSHASSHQNGGSDEIATATPGANAIPKASSDGTLAAGWIPTLNQNTSGNAATVTGFSLASGKILTVINSLTLVGTDSSTLNFGGGGILGTGAYVAINLYATLASPTFTGAPLAPTASAGTNTTQIATTQFVTSAITTAVSGMLNFKGMTDCSVNPNYPAGVKGDSYIVSVAGKIGGASGTSVEVGDWYVATADNAGGTEAAVGASWGHMEHNLVGALLASNNLSDVVNAATAVNNLGGATSTGTGGLVRLNTPTLTTPVLGAATATTINGNAVTTGTGTLTLSTFTITTTGNVTAFSGSHTGSSSGTNTGDQTTVSGSSGSCTGNAATATKLAAGVAVFGVPSFDGSASAAHHYIYITSTSSVTMSSTTWAGIHNVATLTTTANSGITLSNSTLTFTRVGVYRVTMTMSFAGNPAIYGGLRLRRTNNTAATLASGENYSNVGAGQVPLVGIFTVGATNDAIDVQYCVSAGGTAFTASTLNSEACFTVQCCIEQIG